MPVTVSMTWRLLVFKIYTRPPVWGKYNKFGGFRERPPGADGVG